MDLCRMAVEGLRQSYHELLVAEARRSGRILIRTINGGFLATRRCAWLPRGAFYSF